MHDAARWQEYNGRHLEAALAWLRLRLAGPAEGQAADAWDGEVAEAAAALAGLEAGEPLAALVLLGRIFGLSRFERETLLLCAATELDPRIGALCAAPKEIPTGSIRRSPWPCRCSRTRRGTCSRRPGRCDGGG